MRPAFSSNRQAAAFAALLIIVLLLPSILGKNQLPPREQVYSTIPWSFGAFPYLHNQIFEEHEDIDIVFMGSSVMWWGIDTPYFESQLSNALGRKAVARSLCWNWPGFDPLYFIAKDLLEKRKVKMIVFCDLSSGASPTAHQSAVQWFRVGDQWGDLHGLNMRGRMSFYSSAILGTPRNLLGLTRTNRPVIKSDDIWVPLATNAVNPITRLGSLSVQITEDRNFLAYAPETGDKASCVSVYSNETKNDFAFGNFKLMPTQAAFAKKMGNMSEHYGVTLVYLHVPKSTEMHASTIEEAIFWPDAFNADVKLVGIPPVKFFQGISKSDVQKLYFESHHLNANGQKFLTAIITPALINLYETQTKH